MDDEQLASWMDEVFLSAANHAEAVHTAYQQLENAGLINRVTVHRYLCRKCGPRLTVIRIQRRILARSKDYRFGRGKNAAESVQAARDQHTLDGDRHWPGHTYDVQELARFDEHAGMTVVCRHRSTSIRAADVLAAVDGVRPGHAGKPTVL